MLIGESQKFCLEESLLHPNRRVAFLPARDLYAPVASSCYPRYPRGMHLRLPDFSLLLTSPGTKPASCFEKSIVLLEFTLHPIETL